MSKLDDDLAEMARLSSQLGKSMTIQEIWPEAFEAGGCKFGGSLEYDGRIGEPMHTFTSAYFERADGVRRYLTPAEIKRFKPEITINRKFEVPLP